MKKIKVLLCATLMSLIWGSAFPISKLAIDQVGVWGFRIYSLVISVVFLCFVFFIIGRYRFNIQCFLKSIPLGFLNVFLVPILNSLALKHTEAVKASVLVYTMPVMATLLLGIMNKHIEFRSIIVSLLCISGIFIFIAPSGISIGEAIILLSALMWAIGTILSEKIVLKINLTSKVFYQNIVSLIFLVLLMPFLDVDVNILSNIHPEFLWTVYIPIIYMGLANGVIVYILWYYMIEHGGVKLSSYSILISPIISVMISSYLLDESMTISMIIGMLFILLSMLIIFLEKNKV
ncbi:DMT family transporter [Providencia rettgeri]|nr:DMT family transporter [Providencia rettgeri]ELQ1455094.1 DMT family transporter [Providencia rettgeri]ELR5188144.1 DMT family transporter [Providencia rettgeri]EMB0750509.1 DMT family transporter [Providencia rettgeri]